MNWGPEPLGTYARASLGGRRATFYRGNVLFVPEAFGGDGPALIPLGWYVRGSTVGELLAGKPRNRKGRFHLRSCRRVYIGDAATR